MQTVSRLLTCSVILTGWLIATLILPWLSAEAAAPASDAFNSFQGAWFKIKYPSGFTVKPSLRSTTADGYDSAFFTSPDGLVTFYVCAPQWARDPTDIALVPNTETMTATETQQNGGKSVKRYTIQAKDGSYLRSYQDTMAQDGSVRWVIGIQYANPDAYRQYQKLYLTFKQSLTQVAD